MKKVLLGLGMSLFLFGCATTDERIATGGAEQQEQSKKAKNRSQDCEVGRKQTGSRIARKHC